MSDGSTEDEKGYRKIKLLPNRFAILRLNATDALPGWVMNSPFFSITRTADELSIVCDETIVPEGVLCERGRRCLGILGPIPFTVVGLLASLTTILAQAEIPMFAISTFDTDYFLVNDFDLLGAIQALSSAGFQAVNVPRDEGECVE